MFFARKLSRHARFTAGSVIAFALLAGACSSESSVGRVKNAALDVQGPIACTLGGPSPSGGIVVSLSADVNGDSIESVIYPGLKSHKQNKLAIKQQLNPEGKPIFGSIISIKVISVEKRDLFLKKIKLWL